MEATSASTDYSDLITRLKTNAQSMSGWLKFIGIVQIIVGIPSLIVLVGALYIWLGVLLYQAGTAAGSGQAEKLNQMVKKLKTYFVVTGVLMILSLLAMLAGVLFMGLGIFSAMPAGPYAVLT